MASIVYVGQVTGVSSAAQRASALEQLGHRVSQVNLRYEMGLLGRGSWWLRRRTGIGPAHAVNAALMDEVRRESPEVLWVDKGMPITADVLRCVRETLPSTVIIHYSPDDYRLPGNASRDLLEAIPEYDLVVTVKRNNVEWLKARGARRVVFGWQGYDPLVNRPPMAHEFDPTLQGRILLVGSWEAERARTVEALANANLPVTVMSTWPQWSQSVARAPTLDWRIWQQSGRSYSVALGSAAIALGALRKMADDQHTQRSLEIPACGAVLLAERTEEHRSLFLEGVEAEFYGTDEECIEKARRLLDDESRRLRMARAGRQRCLEDGYSWAERMAEVLEVAGVPSSPGKAERLR